MRADKDDLGSARGIEGLNDVVDCELRAEKETAGRLKTPTLNGRGNERAVFGVNVVEMVEQLGDAGGAFQCTYAAAEWEDVVNVLRFAGKVLAQQVRTWRLTCSHRRPVSTRTIYLGFPSGVVTIGRSVSRH